MKIYANLLALSALTGASAFAPSTAFTRSTSIQMSSMESAAVTAIPSAPEPVGPVTSRDKFRSLDTIRVQGDTLRTCSMDESAERVEVLMKTGGRPLHANVELWQGHCNDPQRMKVYMEDGDERTFRVVMETPGSSNSISIRNIAPQEYPLTAGVEADFGGVDSAGSPSDVVKAMSEGRIVQGGAVYTLPFSPAIDAIQVVLDTDGRPMNAKIELLQGPNNVKQSMEMYAEDGALRPIFIIMDSPGQGNQIRIVNTATIEYPLTAYVEPYIVNEEYDNAAKMQWK